MWNSQGRREGEGCCIVKWGFALRRGILGFGLGFCQWEVYFVLSCLGYLLKSILSCSTTWFHGFREGGLSFGFLADKTEELSLSLFLSRNTHSDRDFSTIKHLKNWEARSLFRL